MQMREWPVAPLSYQLHVIHRKQAATAPVVTWNPVHAA